VRRQEAKPIPRNDIERLIIATFPEEPHLALAIARAESNLNPNAVNWRDAHRGCNGSFGVFQIGCLHVDDVEKLYDVEYNIRMARRIYDQSGWQPWGAYTDGSYRRQLAMR
jgi:soluble lytic murein transglycosylase-like protein